MKGKDVFAGLHIEHPNLINKDVYFTSASLEKVFYPNLVCFANVDPDLFELYIMNFLNEYDTKVNMIIGDYYNHELFFSLEKKQKIDRKKVEKRVLEAVKKECLNGNQRLEFTSLETVTFKDVLSSLFMNYWDLQFKLNDLTQHFWDHQKEWKRFGYQFRSVNYDQDVLMIRFWDLASKKIVTIPYKGTFEELQTLVDSNCASLIDDLLKDDYPQLESWKQSLKGTAPITIVNRKNHLYNFYIDGDESYLEDCLINEDDSVKKKISLKPFFHSNFWLPQYLSMTRLCMSLNPYRILKLYLPKTLMDQQVVEEKNPTLQLKNNSK